MKEANKKRFPTSASWWPPVEVFLFNVYREDRDEFPDRVSRPPLEGLSLVLLDASHVEELLAPPDRTQTEAVLKARFARGDICLGVRNEAGELIGFCWSFLHWLYFGTYRMPLKEKEAYVFDVFVVPHYRGKGLAGFIRCKLLDLLIERGHHFFYSVCLRSNMPAIRFRQKLGVRMVDKGFTIKFFNRWRIGTKARMEKIRNA